MKTLLTNLLVVTATVGLAGSVAHADDEYMGDEPVKMQEQPVEDDDMNTRGQPDLDPRPKPPKPQGTRVGVTQQAGIGGPIAYASAGVVELGGSGGFQAASDFTSFDLAPSVGWFFADNMQLSGIFGATFVDIDGGDSSTFFRLLAEPSYHLPFSDTLFGFLGLGVGATYSEDVDFGFAVAPRLGMNFMVGRSGILTPAVTMTYSSNEVAETSSGALVGVSTAFGINIGYTVML